MEAGSNVAWVQRSAARQLFTSNGALGVCQPTAKAGTLPQCWAYAGQPLPKPGPPVAVPNQAVFSDQGPATPPSQSRPFSTQSPAHLCNHNVYQMPSQDAAPKLMAKVPAIFWTSHVPAPPAIRPAVEAPTRPQQVHAPPPRQPLAPPQDVDITPCSRRQQSPPPTPAMRQPSLTLQLPTAPCTAPATPKLRPATNTNPSPCSTQLCPSHHQSCSSTPLPAALCGSLAALCLSPPYLANNEQASEPSTPSLDACQSQRSEDAKLPFLSPTSLPEPATACWPPAAGCARLPTCVLLESEARGRRSHSGSSSGMPGMALLHAFEGELTPCTMLTPAASCVASLPGSHSTPGSDWAFKRSAAEVGECVDVSGWWAEAGSHVKLNTPATPSSPSP
ncbi:hypothetical protein QJQ45_026179 [Haematococcus lacustris]|nr:hypothetical protein QJQ45_026179 [Haematococcus lacustris]